MEIKLPQALLIVVAVVAVIIIAIKTNYDLSYVRSSFDDEKYAVYSNMGEKKEAAMAMSIINRRIIDLASHLKRKWPNDAVTKSILANFNPDHISEITPDNAFGFTSYTVDRGRSMRFCLRDKKTMGLHGLDDLTFVAFHELAHVAEWEANHDLPFWQVFKYLLQEAVSAGIYAPIDYARFPMDYCGMHVEYSPYFDTELTPYSPAS